MANWTITTLVCNKTVRLLRLRVCEGQLLPLELRHGITFILHLLPHNGSVTTC